MIYKQFIKDKHTRCKYCYSLLECIIQCNHYRFYKSFENVINSIYLKINYNKNIIIHLYKKENITKKNSSYINNNRKFKRLKISFKKLNKHGIEFNGIINIMTICRKCDIIFEYLIIDNKNFDILKR